MRFNDKALIDGSLSDTFEACVDFGYFLRKIRASGTTVVRTDRLAAPGPGMTWEAVVPFRGTNHELVVELAGFEAPTEITYVTRAAGLKSTIRFDLAQATKRHTLMRVSLDLGASTLKGRILLKSAGLGKPALNRRFRHHMERLRRLIESRVQRC
ncbi:MAG: hypothetical protein ACE5DK_01010 [Paracoccaceae bacterium]